MANYNNEYIDINTTRQLRERYNFDEMERSLNEDFMNRLDYDSGNTGNSVDNALHLGGEPKEFFEEKNLILEYIVPTDIASVEFNNVDIEKCKIVINMNSNIAGKLYIKINNITSGYFASNVYSSGTLSTTGSLTPAGSYGASLNQIGVCATNTTLSTSVINVFCLKKEINLLSNNITNQGARQYIGLTGGLIQNNVLEKINTINLNLPGGLIKAGSLIEIYRV